MMVAPSTFISVFPNHCEFCGLLGFGFFLLLVPLATFITDLV